MTQSLAAPDFGSHSNSQHSSSQQLRSDHFLDTVCFANCVHSAFEQQAVKTPSAIAVQAQSRAQSGNCALTYHQLNQQANQLAHHLISLGIGADDLVAVSLPRTLEMVVAILAVLKAGGAYVPIDPAYPASRRRYILQDALAGSATPVLLTHSSLATALTTDLDGDVNSTLAVLCLDTDWPQIRDRRAAEQTPYSAENPKIDGLGSQNLAYVIYTSGSTGNPKGVMVKHQGVMNHAAAMATAFEISSADRVLQFSSMSFDIIVEELYPTLITGAALILRPDDIATSLTAFLSFTAAEKVTILNLPTAFWHELVSGLEKMMSQGQGQLSPTVRLVIVGGEKASRSIYAQWYGMVGDYPRWLNTYGPTETTVTATLYDPVAAGFDLSQELPIGKAIANVDTYVLVPAAEVEPAPSKSNGQPRLQRVAAGEPGELYIGGPGLARGYLNLPQKTAVAFVPHPFLPGEKLYKTGDIVRQLPDGNLAFVGRADFQVKIRGFRIELGEIEACLEKHPAVQQPVVLAREDVPGEKRLVAYIVSSELTQFDTAELQAYLREQLPSYMVPTAFVVLPAFPMTPNGKVNRKALPAPTEVASAASDATLPTTPLEAELVALWQQVLSVDTVSTTDNFFELGGHSLLVMRLFSAIETTWQCALPATTILDAPTVQQLAEVLAAAIAQTQAQSQKHADSSGSRLGPASADANHFWVLLKAGKASEPPLFLVHDVDGDTGLYIHLAQQLSGDRAVYGLKPLSQAGVPMTCTRIPEMAAGYISQMRSVQPHGPYLVGGLCAGGVLAAEITLQLEAAGEIVALSALLDAPDVAARVKTTVSAQRVNRLKQASQGLSLAKRSQLLFAKGASALRYETGRAWQQMTTALQIQGMRLWQSQQKRGWTLPETLQGVPVRSIYLYAEKSYLPKGKMRAPVVLIKASAKTEDLEDQAYRDRYQDEDLGWSDRAERPVDTYEVAGGHFSMLKADKVGAIAKILDCKIAEGLCRCSSQQ